MRRIPVAGPSISTLEREYVADAVANAWYERAYEWHARFETAVASLSGRSFAIALPSCTSALHLALAALGVGPGDEVVVPDCTWIATSAPISYLGANPVFCDIDPVTWCASAATVEACLTPRTRAVVVVDLYGNMPDMDGLLELCESRGLHLVEDAAQAIGARYRNRPAGSFGIASTFSFHGSKSVTTGEGGMLVSDDDFLIGRCRFLQDHGRTPGDRSFRNTAVAYKYKMSALQAALGTAQVERIEEIVTRKTEIFQWYADRLSALDGVRLNPVPDEGRSSYWMVTPVWDASYRINSLEMMDLLARQGIDTRPFFHPLSSLPAYAEHPHSGIARQRNRCAYDVSPRALNLPSALTLTESEVAYVSEALTAALTDGNRT